MVYLLFKLVRYGKRDVRCFDMWGCISPTFFFASYEEKKCEAFILHLILKMWDCLTKKLWDFREQYSRDIKMQENGRRSWEGSNEDFQGQIYYWILKIRVEVGSGVFGPVIKVLYEIKEK